MVRSSSPAEERREVSVGCVNTRPVKRFSWDNTNKNTNVAFAKLTVEMERGDAKEAVKEVKDTCGDCLLAREGGEGLLPECEGIHSGRDTRRGLPTTSHALFAQAHDTGLRALFVKIMADTMRRPRKNPIMIPTYIHLWSVLMSIWSNSPPGPCIGSRSTRVPLISSTIT